MNDRPTLSVVINVKNMAETIRQTLESVKNWATEIIVVDMNSDDDTVAIAKKFTKHIFPYQKELGFADPARNFALSKATSDWILVLDADEYIDHHLKVIIDELMINTAPEIVAINLPRQNIIFGKALGHTGWWPDYQLRLFRKGKVQWSDTVHTPPIADGKVESLAAESRNAIIHQNYQHVHQFIDRLNRYTTIQAAESKNSKKELTETDILDAFQREFLRRLFAEKGWQDGVHGVSLSLLQAMYQATVELKTWEKAGFTETKSNLSFLSTLQSFRKQLGYWVADVHVQSSSGLVKLYWQTRRKLKI